MKRSYNYLILLAIFAISGTTAWASAKIEAIGGAETVSVKREGKEVLLKKGDELKAGDEVITSKSSAVDLRFSDKSLIRVGANSSYRLEEDAGKNLFHRLVGGIVRVLVPPKKDSASSGVRFRMNTPEGTIGVRGTEFVVIRQNDQTTLKGLEGEVLFGKANADFASESSFVIVKRGFESSVKAGGDPSSPKAFSLPSYLKEIDGKGNSVFGVLAERSSGKSKARSAVVASAPKASKSLSVPKQRVDMIKKAIPKVEGEKVELDPNEEMLLAASEGNIQNVENLLKKKGVDVNYQDASGFSALLAAIAGEKPEMVKFLLSKGADPNLAMKDGSTPLMVSAENGNAVIALELTEKGARLDDKRKDGSTALQIAEYFEKKNPEKYKDILPVLRGELAEEELSK